MKTMNISLPEAMPADVFLRLQAKRDIVEQALYIAEERIRG